MQIRTLSHRERWEGTPALRFLRLLRRKPSKTMTMRGDRENAGVAIQTA
jgi:hypothetical protein